MTKIHEINVHEKQVLYHKCAQDGIFLQVFRRRLISET